MKKICFVFYFICMTLTLQGQPKIGICHVDTLLAFLQQELLDHNLELERILVDGDSIKENSIGFMQKGYSEIIRRVQGGCLSPQEQKRMEAYIYFIHEITTEILEKVDSLYLVSDNSVLAEARPFLTRSIRYTCDQKQLQMAVDPKVIFYQEEGTPDITEDVLKDLTQNMTEFKASLRFTVAINLLQEIRGKQAELIEYEAYQEKYPIK